MSIKYLIIVITIVLCTLFIANCTQAQNKYNTTWVTGATRSYYIKFDNNNVITKWIDSPKFYMFIGGTSILTDSNGKVRLLCNGAQLYDSLGHLLQNGDSLIDSKLYDYYDGSNAINQSSAIVLPFDSIVFVVTPCISDSIWPSGTNDRLYLHEVNLNANNGLGAVISKKRDISFNYKFGKSGMTACRHANGKDWWLIKQDSGLVNTNFVFYISKDSISAPIINSFPIPKMSYYERAGQMSFNQSATQMAYITERPNKLFVCNFDRCYGVCSNPKEYPVPELLVDTIFHDGYLDSTGRGVCFSPNGRFVYVVMASKVFQLDLQEPDPNLAWYLVHSVDTIAYYFWSFSQAQLGPDGKIYIGKYGGVDRAWNVIENPDLKGAGCNWCNRCLTFSNAGASCPPNIINYNLGALEHPCWPLAISTVQPTINNFIVYPNPAHNEIKIEKGKSKTKELYNYIGQLIFTTTQNKIDVSKYPRGLYFVKCGSEVKRVILE
jgi:hypothetical protein